MKYKTVTYTIQRSIGQYEYEKTTYEVEVEPDDYKEIEQVYADIKINHEYGEEVYQKLQWEIAVQKSKEEESGYPIPFG